MDQDPIVIVAGARTPMGAFQGELASMAAHQLGSVAIGAALERSGVKAEQVDEVIMGCVLPAGQGCRSRSAARRSTRCADRECAPRCTRTTR